MLISCWGWVLPTSEQPDYCQIRGWKINMRGHRVITRVRKKKKGSVISSNFFKILFHFLTFSVFSSEALYNFTSSGLSEGKIPTAVSCKCWEDFNYAFKTKWRQRQVQKICFFLYNNNPCFVFKVFIRDWKCSSRKGNEKREWDTKRKQNKKTEL